MKQFLYISVFSVIAFSFIPDQNHAWNNHTGFIDSGIINHELDGLITEWPSGKFEEDLATKIKYAFDNDSKNLFLAMIIPDMRAQIKLGSQGMNLYTDLNGKKSTDKGIRYPVKKQEGNFMANARPNEGERPDVKTIMRALLPNLLNLQLFGYTAEAPKDQDILETGSANIQFSWDDNNIMYIEYSIPFALLGDPVSLAGKNISIGWKINAMEMPKTDINKTTIPTGKSSQFRPGGRGQGGQQGTNTMMSEQEIWAQYTIQPAK